MTERERWVVYPLLFLALGAALRDKLGGSTKTKSIVCQELRIEDEPSGNQPAKTLAIIRGTEAVAGAPSLGVLEIDGTVNVNGTVNANQYACQGIVLTPAFAMMEQILSALQAAQGQRVVKPQHALPPAARAPASTTPPPPADGTEAAPAETDSDGAAATPK
jgi:hypothetical protein